MLNQIQNGNKVTIEGILSEIDLKPISYTKDNKTVNAISGSIKVRVDTIINGAETTLEIPVTIFANEFTKAGTANSAYASAKQVMNEFISIAASDIERADRVRITNGTLSMNEYYNQMGNLVSFPRVTASFVNKIEKSKCKPTADFTVIFMVGQKGYELDKEGVETNKYKVIGMIPQYGGKVDVVPFFAINPGVIDGVSTYWAEGETVKATGKLNFSSETKTILTEVDFGEPTEETRTVSVSELIITGGSQTPLEGEFAINYDDVKVALEERKNRLAELKEQKKEKKTAAPAPTANKSFSDLGF